MPIVTSKYWVSAAIHVLAWALFAFTMMFYQPLTWDVNLPAAFWGRQCLQLTALVAVFYANSEWIVPNYLLKKRFLAYVLAIILLCTSVLSLNWYFEKYSGLREQMHKAIKTPPPPQKGKFRIDGFLFSTTLMVLGISTSLAVIRRWQLDAKHQEEIEREKIESELAFLKSQINPHFFFNTLNNIFALTYSDVEHSRSALLKLSSMMRYVLYDTAENKASLRKEISFLKDYIELMKLRLPGKIDVEFTEPDPSEIDLEIPPMIFLPFVENAFKHGISNHEMNRILIDYSVEDRRIKFRIENRVVENANALIDQVGGIGLANTRRRLDLLYPDKHQLETRLYDNNQRFQVLLTIELS